MNDANIHDFAVESVTLAGALPGKLAAVRAAGFAQITLASSDLVGYPDGVDAAIATVVASSLRVSAFQTSVDFEGVRGPLHTYKLDVAKCMMRLCHALKCRVLLLPSTTLAHSDSDTPALVRDLRQLAMLAVPMGIKVAYQGWAGGAVVKDYLHAWDIVCEADMPNLGLSLDTYDLLGANNVLPELLEDLDMLDPDKLFLVRLADQLGERTAAWRAFPGEGDYSDSLAAIVSKLHSLGYRDDYSLAVSNTDCASMPAAHVAQRAKASALWLGRDVLQRSVPLPNQIRLRRAARTYSK
jgi:sugar phosphate isomerase/epimerase